MSSLFRTLRSWVRIPLKAWISLCVILCLCCRLWKAALRRADPRLRRLTNRIILKKTEVKRTFLQMGATEEDEGYHNLISLHS
jgi:hypothetical protein